LAIAGLASILAGVRSGTQVHQEEARGSTRGRVTTPVLSARRVPELLARATALQHLIAAVGPLAATVRGDFCFTVAAGGVQLVDHAGDTALMPASNMKLATGFAALAKLGADSVLHTEVAAAAKPSREGTVDGDLWFIGGGDPLIATENYVATNKYGPYPHTSLEEIADRVVAAGVRHVTGAVRGDDHRYDSDRTVSSWPARYVADNQVGPLSALSVNDARTYPVSGRAGSAARPAADPAAYAASALADLLAERGVRIDKSPATGQAPQRRTTLVDMASLPVRDLVEGMLTFSDNNTAELLVKELGVHVRREGTTAAGIAVVADALRDAGIDVAEMTLTDGSGLDRGDRISCRTLQQLLTAAGPTGDIAKGLPVAGTSGTLRDRMRASATRGRIRAKTGSLRDVTALSGWVDGRGDTKLTFSFLLNTGDRAVGAADLRVEEQLATALTNYPDAPDRATLGPLPPAGS